MRLARRFCIFLAGAACAGPGCAPKARPDLIFKRELPEATRAELTRKIGRIVGPHVASPNNPGLVVGVIKDGSALVLGYGKVSLKSDARPDGSTLFEIGSMTKVFTTTLLAEMADAGLLDMKDPVRKHLPESATAPRYKGQEITLFHLATHTSGLPRVPDNLFKSAEELKNPYANYTAERLYAFLSKYKLTRPVGRKYEYSNLGMGLLGHVLALKSGASYEKAVKGRICQKLGMKDTTVTLSPEQRGRLAQGHFSLGMPVGHWDFAALAGAGALRSSANDMLRFLAANLGPSGGRLSRIMNTCHSARAEAGEEGMEIALGWHLTDLGMKIVWHNGGTAGFWSWMGFVKQTKTAVVVLSNSANSVDWLGVRILMLVSGRPMPEDEDKPQNSPEAGA